MLSFTSSTNSTRTRSFSGMSRWDREKVAPRDPAFAQEDDLYRYPTEDECRIIRDTWKLISDTNRFKLLNLHLQGNIPPVPSAPPPNPHDETSINTVSSITRVSVNPNLNAQLMSISASVGDVVSKNGNTAMNNGAPGAVPMRRIPSTRFRDSPYPYPNGRSSTTTSIADDQPSGSHFASPTPAKITLPISVDEPPTPIVNPYRHHTMSTFERPPKVPPAPASAPPEQGDRYVVSGTGHNRDNSAFSFNVRRDSFGYVPVPAPVNHLMNYSAPVPPLPNSHPPSVVSWNHDSNRDTESVNSFSENGSSAAARPPHMQQNGSRAPSTSASTQGNNPFSGLTPEQLAQISPATQFTLQFFQNLVDSYPYMGGIFSDVVKQSTMFSGLLGKMVRDVYNLRDPKLAAEVRKLGYRHRVLYHVSDSMYDALGTSLVRTVRHWLLADGMWTPEIDWAWMAVYNLLSTWMKEGGAWEHTGPPPQVTQPSQPALQRQQTTSNVRYRRSGSVAAPKSTDTSGANDGWERYRDMIKAQQASQKSRAASAVTEDGGRTRREKRREAENKCVIS
ncbi:hypothetical protein BJ742DRAFT_62952 [Cladochytrium replicatum]|nr:hypothetical protein BJ742DRAFT_62952 [Cladochytrium replicatum]